MTDFERPCLDCEEPTWNDHGRCRSCDIDYKLDKMTCKTCGQMRYRTPTELGQTGTALGALAGSLWGKPCECKEGSKP